MDKIIYRSYRSQVLNLFLISSMFYGNIKNLYPCHQKNAEQETLKADKIYEKLLSAQLHDYGFYERQDMLRRGTEKIAFQLNGNPKNFLFFIYENQAARKTV